jgi:hypothetical protein
MTLAEIAALRPKTIEEAIDDMRNALDYFHRENDYRAIFLRAYYLITLAVRDAIHEQGAYTRRLFFDADWIRHLAGKFSLLYFRSLTTEEREGERAWKIAHRRAARRDTSVLQELLFGLNAHINYDLAYGIYLNFVEFEDARNHLLLPRRKFDHDQVNNILVDSIPVIQRVLTRDYGGVMRGLGAALGPLDELLSGIGLKYYRERVWWNAVTYLSAEGPPEIQLVHDRLDWESAQVAKLVALERTRILRPIEKVASLLRRRRFAPFALEQSFPVAEQRGSQVSPF